MADINNHKRKKKLTPEQEARHRARNQRRKRIGEKYMTACLKCFAALWIGIAAFLAFFPRSTVSAIEKRTLATWPAFSWHAYFSGDYTSGITNFYDDTVPFRDFFKNVDNNMHALFGIRPKSVAQIVGDVQKVDNGSSPAGGTESVISGSGESVKANASVSSSAAGSSSAASSSVTASSASSAAGPDTKTGQSAAQTDTGEKTADGELSNGFLIVYQNGHWRGLPLFAGNSEDTYVQALNTLRANLDKKVKLYSMAIPLSSAYYLPSNYTDYSADQASYINRTNSELDESIIKVNVFDTLKEHEDEDIFLRTDHHWQPLGARYAAEVFAKAAGVTLPALDTGYDKKSVDGYVGSMYGYTQNASLLNDPETFTWYAPKNTDFRTFYYDRDFKYQYEGDLIWKMDTDNSYLMFLGTDDTVVRVHSDSAKNSRKLLVLKDSYGNAEIPFYARIFRDVYVADVRYFNPNLYDFIDQMGITDVLVTMDLDSVEGDNAGDIAYMLTQNPGQTYTDEAPVSDGGN